MRGRPISVGPTPLYPTYRPGGTLIGKRSRDAFLREKRFEGNSSDQKMLRELYAQDAVLCLRSTHKSKDHVRSAAQPPPLVDPALSGGKSGSVPLSLNIAVDSPPDGTHSGASRAVRAGGRPKRRPVFPRAARQLAAARQSASVYPTVVTTRRTGATTRRGIPAQHGSVRVKSWPRPK